jgi:hypothetical protein
MSVFSIDADTLLSTLKFVGIFCTGVFSLLPLIVDYRDKDKRINKWGWTGLIGATVSTFVAAASQYFELQKGSADARAALERSNALLAQVKRALNPVKDLKLSACVEVPLDSPDMADIAVRLKQYAAGDIAAHTEDFVDKSTKTAIIRNVSSLINTAPNIEAYKALSDVTISVSFLVSSNKLQDIQRQFSDPTNPAQSDLRIGFLSDNQNTKNQFIYRDGRLFIFLLDVGSDPKYWISSGKIIAIEDLQSAVLMVTLENFSVSGGTNKIGRIRSTFAIRRLGFNMTDGRRFVIEGEALVASHDRSNQPFYLYRFPANENQFPVATRPILRC